MRSGFVEGGPLSPSCQGDMGEFPLNQNLASRITLHLKRETGDFPGGPLVKNLSSNIGNVGSVPDGGTKISHAA